MNSCRSYLYEINSFALGPNKFGLRDKKLQGLPLRDEKFALGARMLAPRYNELQKLPLRDKEILLEQSSLL